eukprot:m.1037391 g.1037391  ORF g.1037391 m.1037391 type:complete len:531 (-) comp24143_c0_seq9:191-1783(-)
MSSEPRASKRARLDEESATTGNIPTSKYGESALVGAIDQGTTSSRFIIFNKAGEIVVSHQMEHRQILPHPGWSEHDPMEILENVKICIDKSIEKLEATGRSASDVVAIGITNQRETTVAWSRKNGKPLHNAIVWLDTRTSDLVASYTEPPHDKDRLREKCGLPISTYFSALKIRWMLDNVPAVKAAADDETLMVGTMDTWLMYGLCGGVFATDVTNASRTMLMNLRGQHWDNELCDFFKIPIKVLPEIKSNAEVYGNLTVTALKSVPVSGCIGDQHAATLGQGCLAAGEAKNTYGTGCFLLMNVGGQPVSSKNGLLSTICFKLGPDATVFYALEGSCAIAGAAVQWLRDEMQMISSAGEIEQVASTVADTGGVYFVPAFSGLLAPHWRPDARGCIVGMTQYTNRAHICRAVLESVCFQSQEVFRAMEKDARMKLKSIRVDGGMTANNLLMQIQADLAGVPISVPCVAETTALGAAFAAGFAVGVWTCPKEIRTKSTVRKTWTPTIDILERAGRTLLWDHAVKRSLGWACP